MSHRARLLVLLVAVCATANAQLQIAPANANPADFGPVTGTVTSMQNRPIANARVELRDLASGQIIAATYSRRNGSFELINIPNSAYEVVATSGVVQATERINNSKANNHVELRLSVQDPDNGANSTVSVAALMVPDKARKEFEKAAKAYDDGKPVEKITKHLSRALEIAPKFAEALTLKAVLLLKEDKFAEAKSLFQQAIDSDPTFATPYVALASLMTYEERFDEALRTLDRAVALAPNMWQIYFEMGKALLGKGDFEGSLRTLNRAEKLNSETYGPIHLVKAHALLGLRNYKRAVTELHQFLQTAPSGPDSDRARKVLQQAQAFAATGAAATH